MTHLVTFRIGGRDYAAPLGDVREVVRLQGVVDLPGMAPPLAGVLDLRGTALPVLDLRLDPVAPGGDVLVLEGTAGEPFGVAVDAVRAVLRDDDLPVGPAQGSGELPAYVVQVRAGSGGPVFLVDLQRMVDSRRSYT